MRKILTRYEVDPTFLPVLFSFGEMPHLAESGSSNIASPVLSDGSQSKVAATASSVSVLTIPQKSPTRSVTRKRIIGRGTGPGLSDRRVSTTTTRSRVISTFLYYFIRLKIAFSSNKWGVLRRCSLPRRN